MPSDRVLFRPSPARPRPGPVSAFTLVELLVVVSIIGLLMAILVPALAGARKQGRATVCLHNLHVLGHGISAYAQVNGDILMPSRLPKLDNCNAYGEIGGGRKYRPTFLAIMGESVGVPAFDDPKRCKDETDRFGQAGDRQDYSSKVYVCPAVPTWTDERNGAYGYNYQFLGNSRLRDSGDPNSFKNWPVPLTRIRHTSSTVAVADCMGTAASWSPHDRGEYENSSRDAHRFGNEGFNLDPPRVDAVDGEMANFDSTPQSRASIHPRHLGRAAVLWLDAHGDTQTFQGLGYKLEDNDIVGFDGDNTLWSGTGRNVAWTMSGS